MKILFVMDKRVNAGSIHAVANYVRAGDCFGHTIALYGRQDPGFPHLRLSTDLEAFDHVVFVIESGLRWMSGLRLPRILFSVPRRRRAILDTDGMYNPLIAVDGYDRNHASERERLACLTHYHELADRIFQPTFEPREPGVRALPFYGFDPGSICDPDAVPSKRFDLMHVGHNWWRWRELSTRLLPAIEKIRARVGDICFVGSWWNRPPLLDEDDHDLEVAFRINSDVFRRLGIQVRPAVSYTHVIPAMSEGQVNIMTQRPLLRHLKLLTSKYFEIFCADTIPLVMLDPDHAHSVYGPAGRELALHDGIACKLLEALNQPRKYREIVQEVRQYLIAHHSYRDRVRELVAALES